MLKIALTGGIGTGKTYLSKHFVEMGIPVFYADEEAKKLYNLPEVIQFFHSNFGEAVFTNQNLDFQKLASVVFSHQEFRLLVNKFIHPLVFEKFEEWAKMQNAPSVMMESAIIFEAHLEHHFDKIIVVDAPLEVRIERIKKRSPHLSDEEIRNRINAQISQEIKCKKADLVILN
ncbi:MAG TPA: dephospho-CoA kinase [Bacteroidales bacterium]|nr:dephospho-CoA kinase [Bacteroidales bacterium]HPS72398.1 dephospho-CoA kinase [Bacteroidales bacterium]